MKLAVVTNEVKKQELLSKGLQATAVVSYLEQPEISEGADAYIDLLFEERPAHEDLWRQLKPSLLIVNAVCNSCRLPGAIRINGWPGFLSQEIIEATGDEKQRDKAAALFSVLNRTIEWVPDICGLVAPRIISMIINEAYFALEEGVSDQENIDTAMKLGTNYPRGPFEWAEKIGTERIIELLRLLAEEDRRYLPASLLQEKALRT